LLLLQQLLLRLARGWRGWRGRLAVGLAPLLWVVVVEARVERWGVDVGDLGDLVEVGVKRTRFRRYLPTLISEAGNSYTSLLTQTRRRRRRRRQQGRRQRRRRRRQFHGHSYFWDNCCCCCCCGLQIVIAASSRHGVIEFTFTSQSSRDTNGLLDLVTHDSGKRSRRRRRRSRWVLSSSLQETLSINFFQSVTG